MPINQEAVRGGAAVGAPTRGFQQELASSQISYLRRVGIRPDDVAGAVVKIGRDDLPYQVVYVKLGQRELPRPLFDPRQVATSPHHHGQREVALIRPVDDAPRGEVKDLAPVRELFKPDAGQADGQAPRAA